MHAIATIGLLFVAVAATGSTARADAFVSPGVSIAFGSRGWSFGVEISAGQITSRAPVFPGLVAGFEVSPFAKAGQPWGRLYGEVELVTLFVGAGVGPALLLGENAETSLQVTPFLAIPAGFIMDTSSRCGDSIPFVVPYYRYTTSSVTSGLHDVGLFGKQVFEVSNSACLYR